jgi:hypothetical protein
VVEGARAVALQRNSAASRYRNESVSRAIPDTLRRQ